MFVPVGESVIVIAIAAVCTCMVGTSFGIVEMYYSAIFLYAIGDQGGAYFGCYQYFYVQIGSGKGIGYVYWYFAFLLDGWFYFVQSERWEICKSFLMCEG